MADFVVLLETTEELFLILLLLLIMLLFDMIEAVGFSYFTYFSLMVEPGFFIYWDFVVADELLEAGLATDRVLVRFFGY